MLQKKTDTLQQPTLLSSFFLLSFFLKKLKKNCVKLHSFIFRVLKGYNIDFRFTCFLYEVHEILGFSYIGYSLIKKKKVKLIVSYY